MLRTRLVIIGLAGIALAALAAWLVMRRATRPIEQLTDTAEHIAETQDLTTPIPVKGDDEVGRLAASFNTMLVALDTSREQQQRLVVDASHELRTPLTAVRTNIDFLGAAPTLDAEQRAQLIAETRLELDELTNLVSEMVELATDVRSEEAVEPVALAEVADDVATALPASHRHRHQRRHRSDVGRGRRPPGDARPGRRQPGRQRVEVQPGGRGGRRGRARHHRRGRRPGPGIDAEDRRRVFDRFYRATERAHAAGLGPRAVDRLADRRAARRHGDARAS